jgi:hypothetical protein
MNRFLKYWDSPFQFITEVFGVICVGGWVVMLWFLLPIVMNWGL